MAEDIQDHHYKSGIEALLFVSDKPISVDQFRAVFPELKPAQIAVFAEALKDEYATRNGGTVIVEIAGGWQMLSNSHAAGYIREFYKTKTKEKLSKPALESLAIVAYKQPVGRAEVEMVRGVNSDGTLAHLLNKGLIEIVGRKEVPGRPFLYGTTRMFLDYFGLRSLEGLPRIEELSDLDIAGLAARELEATRGETPIAAESQPREGETLPPLHSVHTDPAHFEAAQTQPSVQDSPGPDAAGQESGDAREHDHKDRESLSREPSGQSRLDNGIATTAQ